MATTSGYTGIRGPWLLCSDVMSHDIRYWYHKKNSARKARKPTKLWYHIWYHKISMTSYLISYFFLTISLRVCRTTYHSFLYYIIRDIWYHIYHIWFCIWYHIWYIYHIWEASDGGSAPDVASQPSFCVSRPHFPGGGVSLHPIRYHIISDITCPAFPEPPPPSPPPR